MIQLIYIITLILSIVSQTPSGETVNPLLGLKYVWILPGILLFLSNTRAFQSRKVLWMYAFVGIFVMYIWCLQTFTGVEYLGSDSSNLVVSMMVAVVSFVFWKRYQSDKLMKAILFVLITSSTIIAIIGYVKILQYVSVSRLQYAPISKNSLGQILLCQVILVAAFWNKTKKFTKIWYIVCLFILLPVIFLLKSRATLLGLFCVIGYYIFRYGNLKVRIILGVLVSLVVVLVMSIPEYYEVVVNNIILANRGNSDIDRISSGRVTLLAENLKLIPAHLLWGVGSKYMDCFPVMQLVQFGLFGAIIVFLYIIKICSVIVRQYIRDKNDAIYLSTFLLMIVFLINSLFEAQPPFGPGVKCFILWMMFGFSLAHKSPQKVIDNVTSPSKNTDANDSEIMEINENEENQTMYNE